MWDRLKFWMMGSKDCTGCCLCCSHFKECSKEVFSEMSEREAYERDVCIEDMVKERVIYNYRG